MRDCAGSCNSSVPRFVKVSTIRRDEEYNLWAFVFGSRTGNTLSPSKMSLCTHTPTARWPAISRFPCNFFQFHGNPEIAAIWGWTCQIGIDEPPNECVYVCVCTSVCVCELCVGVCVCVCVHGCVRISESITYTDCTWSSQAMMTCLCALFV